MTREKWLAAAQFILLHLEGRIVRGGELTAKAEKLFGPLDREAAAGKKPPETGP